MKYLVVEFLVNGEADIVHGLHKSYEAAEAEKRKIESGYLPEGWEVIIIEVP